MSKRKQKKKLTHDEVSEVCNDWKLELSSL